METALLSNARASQQIIPVSIVVYKMAGVFVTPQCLLGRFELTPLAVVPTTPPTLHFTETCKGMMMRKTIDDDNLLMFSIQSSTAGNQKQVFKIMHARRLPQVRPIKLLYFDQ